jgi:hypothetical protein
MRTAALFLLSIPIVAACGGNTSSAAAGPDGGNTSGCPDAAPASGAACGSDSLQCTYGQNIGCDGYWVCTSGSWSHEYPGVACVVTVDASDQ